MKTYTESEVKEIVRTAIKETVNGMMKWVEEETIIVDTATQLEIHNCELKIKPGPKKNIMRDYVWPLLEKHGIVFTKISKTK